MQPEHFKWEKRSTIIIGLALLGLFFLKPGPFKTTCNVLITISVLFYMASKTIRFWKFIDRTTRMAWMILIISFVIGSLLPIWLNAKIWGIVAVAAIFVFSNSINIQYKKWLVQHENDPSS